MILLEPEIVKQIARGKRQMVRVPVNGRKPKPGACIVRGSKSALRCSITITQVEDTTFDDRPVWTIRFTRGVDEDRYPAQRVGGAGGDYTSIPSRKLNGTGAEVSAHELSRFVAMRDEREPDRLAEQKRRASLALSEIRARYMHPSPEVNRELREAQERIRAIRPPARYNRASPSEQVGGDVASAQSGA